MSIELKPRQDFLDTALACGASLTGKPDGSEAITVVFTIDAWRKFDSAIQQAENEPGEPIYQICKADSVSVHSAWVDVDKQAYDDAGLYPEYQRRMLYTHPAPGVPDGYVLVRYPITEGMHEAACKVLIRSHGLSGVPQRMLTAMLAAAQAQEGGK